MTTMTPVSRMVMSGAFLLLAACASPSARRGNPYSSDLEERREVRVEVQNHNFSDATIWAVMREGHRKRLGIVTGKSDSVFTLPWTFSEPLRFEFDLLAGPRCTTEALAVDPGDTLELQISTDIGQMSDWCR